MVTKKDQKYILEAVHDEKVAEKIVEYLNVHKKEVGPEALFTSDGNSKMLFKSLFQESWNPEDFLKRLPFFYETVSLDEFDDYDDGLMYFDCTYGLSFEGILEEFDNPTVLPGQKLMKMRKMTIQNLNGRLAEPFPCNLRQSSIELRHFMP